MINKGKKLEQIDVDAAISFKPLTVTATPLSSDDDDEEDEYEDENDTKSLPHYSVCN